MNKTDDNFLLNLGKYCSKSKQKGTVYLTLKRYIAPENRKFKPGNSQKNSLIEKDLKEAAANQGESDKHYPLHCRASCGDLKVSSQVDADKTPGFSKSVLGQIKLHFFKRKLESASKKIKKPTPRDPKSKRSMKLKARIQFKKQKKLKKKEKKVLKSFVAIKPTGSLKTPTTGKSGSKMDIEK